MQEESRHERALILRSPVLDKSIVLATVMAKVDGCRPLMRGKIC